MKIALTSPNGTTLSGHAGKCPGYLVFVIEDGKILPQEHVKLTRQQTLRNLEGRLSDHPDHPLYGMNVFITQGLGEGLMRKLHKDKITIYQTEEPDPINALKQFHLINESLD
ncbi:NifB/NifX family molybdenum-iron cluster-binding protein [Thiomicrorhabdus sp. zzn3]|uniref:NifB/NifX family molybdenum-iron cluster-binding protein n=1 Tax=Thiomicrorhabdus sp. zzn3 TaxID=3039775 RepID=UPI002436E494|nr:NifB/NifX family molybdenum-iron cluster-binding protein [Thiomicrorhabdus sp. zzn3]MDG6778428.1 NifB/NifX family molybdenum-iron cluster-binding protein [Thiomicrorhabdus sp. zzn3]